ncbi:MAG: hypothetical protein JWO67_4697 [Streptosporangiaceae bacterium]|nr:hypothetical protein [Streptosporangiaceae bacterium]
MNNALPGSETTSGARNGCTVCTSQNTLTMDGIHGRRCGPHAPAFDPAVAVAIAVHDSHAALAYVRVQFGETS